ncbi:MAG: DUF1015 domain-containing protein [Eubacteriales bacterium]|nr:DUF1015 domain-containing protein [Eubacteriales bacterium]
MAEIRPFQAIRPQKGYESKIAALPYDVFSLQEARAEVQKQPLSFLAVDRPETIAGKEENIYEKAGNLLWKQIKDGNYVQDEQPCYYIYELTDQGRSQTGIGALTSVDDYLNGVTRRHENTRADKEADRVSHVQSCKAQTGPIFLAYRAKEEIGAIVKEIKEIQKPVYDFTSSDGVRHRMWPVEDVETIETLYEAFENVENFYIADGHHRCAAAVSYALKMRRENPSYSGEEPWNFILSVLFPDEELKILDYNRVVRDLNGMSEKQFLSGLGKYFEVEFAGSEAVSPKEKGVFGMYLKDGWYTLYIRKENMSDDPVEGLDVSLLQQYLLAPVLGILEPRTDKRISFVGGIRGLSELERLVDQNGGAAFSMYPTAIEELFAVADAGRLMPPKSTWFEPKLRSGLLIYPL